MEKNPLTGVLGGMTSVDKKILATVLGVLGVLVCLFGQIGCIFFKDPAIETTWDWIQFGVIVLLLFFSILGSCGVGLSLGGEPLTNQFAEGSFWNIDLPRTVGGIRLL